MLHQWYDVSQLVLNMFWEGFSLFFSPMSAAEAIYELLSLIPGDPGNIADYALSYIDWLANLEELLHGPGAEFFDLLGISDLLFMFLTTEVYPILLLSPALLIIVILIRLWRLLLDVIPFA